MGKVGEVGKPGDCVDTDGDAGGGEEIAKR